MLHNCPCSLHTRKFNWKANYKRFDMLLFVEEAIFFSVLIFLADLELGVLLHNYGQLDPLLETVCFCGFETVERLPVM